MSNLYAAQNTYINKASNLTPKQFGDKVDLFYDDLVADDRILAVNISTDENFDMDLHLVVDVPEGTEPQAYFGNTINEIVRKSLSRSSLSVTVKVAERVPVMH